MKMIPKIVQGVAKSREARGEYARAFDHNLRHWSLQGAILSPVSPATRPSVLQYIQTTMSRIPVILVANAACLSLTWAESAKLKETDFQAPESAEIAPSDRRKCDPAQKSGQSWYDSQTPFSDVGLVTN